MNNKYIIALALMLGVVFTGHVSAQLTTMGMTDKAKTEAIKPADDATTKSAEDVKKDAALKEDEKASVDKDAKKDIKKEGAVQTCGQASDEEEEED